MLIAFISKLMVSLNFHCYSIAQVFTKDIPLQYQERINYLRKKNDIYLQGKEMSY